MENVSHPDFSGKNYAEYLDLAGIVSWDWNLRTNRVIYNARWEELSGYKPDEAGELTDYWKNLVFPEDLPETLSQIRKIVSGETTLYEAEYRLAQRDGHFTWCRDSGRTIERDSDGKPLRIIGTIQNLENKKFKEYSLFLENEVKNRGNEIVSQDRMFRQVNEIAKNLLSHDESGPFDEIVFDSLRSIGDMMDQDSTYIYKDTIGENNELACVKIYEWMRDNGVVSTDAADVKSIPYGRLSSIKNTLDNLKCLNDYTENLSLPERELLEPMGIKTLLVAPIVIDDKRWGFIGVDNHRKRELFTKSEENTLLVSGFLLGSAIQKRIHYAKFRDAEERVQVMLNATPLCCNMWDKDFNNISCNDEAVRLFELKDQQEYLDRFFELSPLYQPNGRPTSDMAIENITKAFKEGYCRFEWMHQKLNGEPVPSEITLVRVKYKNEYMVAGYTRDLREAKAMLAEIHKGGEALRAARDEALASSRTKSEFLAKMSHEIRTPMNAIVGMSELILREYLNPAVKEYATTIKQASVNLLSIINDILDLSKIESGKLEIMSEKYELPSVINDVVNIISMRLTDKPIIFSVAIDSILPDKLIGDEVRVRQILLNILSNAVKYTEKGNIALEMYSEFKSREKLNLIIDVTDTGIGIQENDLKNLFGDYAKFDITRNKGVEGTGLGLAITKNLCNAMGGDITVESTYGKGSTFRVVLPQKFQTYREIALVNSPEKHNVLLYETREAYAEPVKFSLDNLGVRSSLTSEESEFQEAFMGDKYSYIFLPSFLYYKSHNILKEAPERKNAPRLVVITDGGEAVNDLYVTSISQPVYSVTIANILNETEQSRLYDKPGVNIRFTAPDARVLIVDDISTNLKVAKGLMSPFNMQIETCESGTEAVELVNSNHYDIVFMDHMMPVMDGIMATNEIRKTRSREELTVIALTANAVAGVKEMFLSNGFNDFLAKPIEMQKLSDILEKWVPEDKKESFSSKSDIDANTDVSIAIEGVNVGVGLSMTGGGLKNYIDVLDVFRKDGEKKISEIEDSLKSEDIKLYATYVHALKSALGSIGAAELSNAAKALEFAAKNGNMKFIENNNYIFLRELKKLLKKIGEAIKTENNGQPKGELRLDSIKPELLNLKEALQNIDGAAMDEFVRQLKEKCRDSNFEDKADRLEQHILMCEYDEAIEYIDSFIGEFAVPLE